MSAEACICGMCLQHRGTLDHESGPLKEGIDKTVEAAIVTADKTQEVASAAADKTKEVSAQCRGLPSLHISSLFAYNLLSSRSAI